MIWFTLILQSFNIRYIQYRDILYSTINNTIIAYAYTKPNDNAWFLLSDIVL